MKLNEVTLFENKSHRILQEGWQDLTEAQKLYQSRWERELWPLLEQYVQLCENKLTPDEIQKVFTSAEQVQNALGKNTNALGKAGNAAKAAAKLPIDLAKKIDAKITELGRAAQNAEAVVNADAKFEKLKADIMKSKPDNKVVKGITAVSDWAKENPGKASIAVGILTTIAAFAGGPAGGLAAGMILRSTKELLQGEKLSTAVGKSVKTAAYGAIAGWALQGIGEWFEGLRYDAVPFEQSEGLVTLEIGFKDNISWPGFESTREIGSMVLPESQLSEFTQLLDQMKAATAVVNPTTDPGALNAFDELWKFTKEFDTQEFIANMNLNNEIAQMVAAENDAFLQSMKVINDGLASIAQGSITAKGENTPVKVGSEEYTAKDTAKAESLDMNDRFAQYLKERQVDEAPFGDMIKKGAKAAGGAIAKGAKAVGAKAKEVGKELGSIATAKKLNAMWVKAGKPMDVGSIVNILQQGGVQDKTISTIAKQSNVALPIPKDANAVDPKMQALADQIKQLGVAQTVKAMLTQQV